MQEEKFWQKQYGYSVDYLECKSTNCGNNITNLLTLLMENEIPHKSVILSQDATMQLRMSAGLQKYVEEDTQIINYATYQAKVILKEGKPVFQNEIWGMWDLNRYITLLLGEIVRLRDDEAGYGPKGQNFITHVDIPQNVETAFELVNTEYAGHVREADSRYA